MKITNSSQAPKPAATTGAVRTGASGKGAALKGATTASVFGDSSTRVSASDSQVSPTDFSAAKVNEISSAIASGRYQVNAGAVADKLLASSAALAGKTRAAS